jgi:hypothetical protein
LGRGSQGEPGEDQRFGATDFCSLYLFAHGFHCEKSEGTPPPAVWNVVFEERLGVSVVLSSQIDEMSMRHVPL